MFSTCTILTDCTCSITNVRFNSEENVNIPAKACNVVPPMWHAAAPVLAVTNVLCGGSIVIKRFKRYDFPVPALPVKNTLLPDLTALSTAICSAVKFVWKELRQLRRLLGAPLLIPSTSPAKYSFPVLIRFGVLPLFSSRGRFLQPVGLVKSLSVKGLTFSNERGFSLRSLRLLLASPVCLLWASFKDKHFRKAPSWFGGQLEIINCSFCFKSLIVAFPSRKKRLWMLISFKRKVLPSGDLVLTIRSAMSRNSSLPITTVMFLYVRRFVTIPFIFRLSTVKQHSSSLASIINVNAGCQYGTTDDRTSKEL